MSFWDMDVKELFGGAGGDKEEAFQKEKMEAIEKLLGPAFDMVGTPRIPFQFKGNEDGRLSRFYFPNAILPSGGTGYATAELATIDGKGPKNADGYYELVAFTTHPFQRPAIPAAYNEDNDILGDAPEEKVPDTPYTRAEARIWHILNSVAYYATRQKEMLKPGDTLEFPADRKTGQSAAYVFFARYSSRVKPFFSFKRIKAHLMLVMELTREEFKTARQAGAVNMTNYLKVNGRWPYSLDPGQESAE